MYNIKILIVDDEHLIRKSLKRVFRKENYTILEAENGLEALEIVKNNTPNIIITDLNMPKMSGIDLVKNLNLKNDESFKVIVLSGGNNHSGIEECFKAGVSSYYHKPFDEFVLRGIVSSQLQLLDYQNNLRFKNQLENILTSISTKFINVSTNIIFDLIIDSLKQISSFLNVDAVFFSLNLSVKKDDIFYNLSSDDEMFAEFNDIIVELSKENENIDDVVVYDKQKVINGNNKISEIFKNHKLKSLAVIPVSVENNKKYHLIFISKNKIRIWKNDSLGLLKAMNESFYNALQKKIQEEEKSQLQKELIKRKELDVFNAMVITANHEINQPLAVLSGNIQLLPRYFEKNETEKTEKCIVNIRKSIKKIELILNRLKEIKNPEYVSYYKQFKMVDIHSQNDEQNE